MTPVTLDDLGTRICILGPSNSGKSTLAQAISRSRDLTPVHLDQLHHLPDTDWVPRPQDEFAALHDAVIQTDRWVIDGSYSRLLPQRLERATGLILLDVSTLTSLFRYLRRSWFERDRVGGLEGGRDSVKWAMIHHIAVVNRAGRARNARLFHELRLPRVRLDSPGAVDAFYQANGLIRIRPHRRR